MKLVILFPLVFLGITDTRRFFASGVQIVLKNNCHYTVWAAMYGRSKYNPSYRPPNGGGWELRQGQRVSLNVPSDFVAGRWWGRTGCQTENGNFRCETGDCGPWLNCGDHKSTGIPPATLAEITLAKGGDGKQDFYDISLVDGFNIPITMTPINRRFLYRKSDQYWCNAPNCKVDLNKDCPFRLRYQKNGRTVGCKSACVAFNTDQFCCRGAHNRPDTCRPIDWPYNWNAFFKQRCPTSYSYAYDDKTSTFRCSNADYQIDFC